MVKRCRLIDRGDKIVIGVSGGPDSLALLYFLAGVKKQFGLSLCIAHLDHMMRRDSAKDTIFIKTLGEKFGLPVFIGRADVKKLARNNSPEEAARNARLSFLFSVAKRVKADKLALGHNLDDQAETVLMRVLRGAGLYGLAGILPKRKINGFVVIRPLLEVRRKQICAFLSRKKIIPLQDPSNSEDVYLRNKIRNRLMPLLEGEYNKNIKEVLANMAQGAACDYDYLSAAAFGTMKRAKSKYNLVKFSRLHPAIQRLLIRRAISAIQGDTRRINFGHIREIEDLLLNRPVNSVVDLPKGISARKSRSSLLFYRR